MVVNCTDASPQLVFPGRGLPVQHGASRFLRLVCKELAYANEMTVSGEEKQFYDTGPQERERDHF
jgi:hypothetical protein